jgi:c-di-GMP-binding flagellar brake protein YcgR
MSDYEVTSKRQILAYLSAMHDKNQLLEVKPTGSSLTSLSAIVDIDDAQGIIIIDILKDEAVTQRAVDAGSVDIEGLLDHIKISFTSQNFEICEHEGRPAISLSIPDVLIRLQRREFYRVPTPIINPVLCKIPATSWDGPTSIALPVRNISSGGIQALDETMQIDSTLGKVYRNCTIYISAAENFSADLEVKNTYSAVTPGGHMGAKIGFQFVRLDGKSENILQKYINRLELEQRAIKR